MFKLQEENGLLVCQYHGSDQVELNAILKKMNNELIAFGFSMVSYDGYTGKLFKKETDSQTIEVVCGYDGYSDGVGLILFGACIEAKNQQANPYIRRLFEIFTNPSTSEKNERDLL